MPETKPPNTVLVVEDEMDMRFFLKTFLKTNGFSPVLTRNGQEGLKRLNEMTPDLILLDVMMPEKGGALVYQELKSDPRTKGIPVVMISGVPKRNFYHYLDMLRANLDTPLPAPDAYVEKPPDPDYLLNLLKGLLSERHAPFHTDRR